MQQSNNFRAIASSPMEKVDNSGKIRILVNEPILVTFKERNLKLPIRSTIIVNWIDNKIDSLTFYTWDIAPVVGKLIVESKIDDESKQFCDDFASIFKPKIEKLVNA